MLYNTVKRRGDIGCLILFLLIIIFAPLIVIGIIWLVAEAKNEQTAKERHTIEGLVVKVETYTVEPPPPLENVKKDTNERGIHVQIKPKHTKERLKVSFKDNRVKEFVGVSPKPLEVDRYYIITYDGFDRIVAVEEKK